MTKIVHDLDGDGKRDELVDVDGDGDIDQHDHQDIDGDGDIDKEDKEYLATWWVKAKNGGRHTSGRRGHSHTNIPIIILVWILVIGLAVLGCIIKSRQVEKNKPVQNNQRHLIEIHEVK